MTDQNKIELYNTLSKILPPFINSKFQSYINLKDDIINDVYLKIIKKGVFDPKKGTKYSYYIAICQYHIGDLIRKEKTRLTRHYKYIDKNNLIEGFDTNKSYENEHVKSLEHVLSKLTRVERYILTEKYINKKRHFDIYNYLNISEQTFLRYKNKLNKKIKELIINNPVLKEYIKDINISIKDEFYWVSDIETEKEIKVLYNIHKITIKVPKRINNNDLS